MAFSNDDCAQIYNSKSKLTAKLSPGHADSIAKNGQINHDGSMAATTGSDGFINLYQISEVDGQIESKFVQKIKISKELSIIGNENFDFNLEWLPSNEDLLISGNNSLGIISKDEEGNWAMNIEDSVTHQ